jgi:hypothetical protein
MIQTHEDFIAAVSGFKEVRSIIYGIADHDFYEHPSGFSESEIDSIVDSNEDMLVNMMLEDSDLFARLLVIANGQSIAYPAVVDLESVPEPINGFAHDVDLSA